VTTAALEALVSELEGVSLDVATDELEALTGGLERRQKILDQLQEADASRLDPAARRGLWERLETVRARDADVLAGLVQWHAEIAEALGESGRARTAARGYRASTEPVDAETRRTA
jgi:hypothetical protein